MNCGRVKPWDERYSFEQLATAYEYSTTSGAERFYKKIVDKLTGLLVDAGVLGAVELKLTDKNKKNRRRCIRVQSGTSVCQRRR